MIHTLYPHIVNVLQLHTTATTSLFALPSQLLCVHYYAITAFLKAYLNTDTPPPGRRYRFKQLKMPDLISGIFLWRQWWGYHFVKT